MDNLKKKCSRCYVEKELTEFNYHNEKYVNACKSCCALRKVRKKTLEYRVLGNLRILINKFFKFKGKVTTLSILGCKNFELLKDHLDIHTTADMTWDNYGYKWTFVFIKSPKEFDLNAPEQLKETFRYTNLKAVKHLKYDEKTQTGKPCSRCKIFQPFDNFILDTHSGRRKTWCKSCANAHGRIYKENNREKLKIKRQEYLKTSSYINSEAYLEKMRMKHRAYRKYRSATDPVYKIRHSIRRRILYALSGCYKSAKTLELLGCSAKECKKYLEDKFEQMFGFKFDWSWHNHKQYHIDHIIPCAAFNLLDPEAQRKCFHYTNLQLLPAHENLVKNSKLNYQIPTLANNSKIE